MKAVTKVIFKNDNRRNIATNDGIRGMFFNVIAFIIVFGSIGGFMTWASVYMTRKLDAINQGYAFINIMLLGNFLILFFESIFQILNSLYYSRDLKILLRMPIKPRDIVHGKLLKLIVAEYQMESIMLMIPMIVHGVMHSVGLEYYLYTAIIMLILPVIPISITAVVVAFIMRFVNIMKNKTKAMYITIILTILGLNIILSVFGGQLSIAKLLSDEVLNTENGISREISNGFKLISPILSSLENYDNVDGIKSILIYVIESIIIYVIAVILIAPVYLKGAIGTIAGGNKKLRKENIELTIKDFERCSLKDAYISKEYKVLRRSPIFFIQCIIMPLLTAVIMFIVSVYLYKTINNIEANVLYQIRNIMITSLMAGGFACVIQLLYMLNFASIIAISKEEKAAIITKYIPVRLSRQLNLKLLIGKAINFISCLPIIFLYYACTNNVLYSILVLIMAINLNLVDNKIKILIDLNNPRTDWDSEFAMMKQNTNVMFELFYTMLVSVIAVVLGLIIKNINAYFIVMIIATILSNLMLNNYILKNENNIFKKLY